VTIYRIAVKSKKKVALFKALSVIPDGKESRRIPSATVTAFLMNNDSVFLYQERERDSTSSAQL
jgi:hypothetical protein